MTRDLKQSMDALAVANEVRLARKEIKCSLKEGEITFQEILREPLPQWLEGMPIEQLLCAVRGIHRDKACRILKAVNLYPARPMGFVTPRQRLALIELMDERGKKVMQSRARA